jgi:ribosome-binding protein aMBF1 (putative translation factor)
MRAQASDPLPILTASEINTNRGIILVCGKSGTYLRVITMVTKLSDLRTAAEIHEQDMKDLDYRREYERTELANDVAIKVLRYRTEHGLSQAALGRMVGMRQPHIARLESGEHEPSLSTLARLSTALGLDFSVDVKPSGLKLRYAVRERKRA